MGDFVDVRPLTADEWSDYREVRLAALLADPESFGQRHEDEANASDDKWSAFVARSLGETSTILVAEDAGSIVGIASAGLREASRPDEQDSGEMWVGGMWVRPDRRGRGIGRALLEAALAWGRAAGASCARLAVTAGNRDAERLYAGAGFEPTGETGTLNPESSIAIRWLKRSL